MVTLKFTGEGEIFYLQNEEKISTLGETNMDVESKYKIKGSDLTLLRNKMILSSNEKATIKDNNSNVYNANEFKYFIGEDIRLEPVLINKEATVAELLEFYMGKNTPDRQKFIIENLKVIEDDI